jgi:hypothetical protein
MSWSSGLLARKDVHALDQNVQNVSGMAERSWHQQYRILPDINRLR